ncbi:MAG: hypothetical protein ACJ8AG_21080 [Ktedonobacteraceae bacterium]
MLLVFKLLLTPLLIGLVSLVGRRWGPIVSGWLVGLPLTSGPVALFLALEQGTAFASRAAQGTLLGLISVAGFCLAYSWFSLRLGWLGSILASWSIFFALTALLELISISLVFAFAGVIASLAIVLILLPGSQGSSVATAPPAWETPLRMLVATAFVVVLTAVAGLLGPQLSGLLTPFPLYATILAVFTHHFQGSSAARQILRGTVSGSFTFAVFFLLVSFLLAKWGIVATFSFATFAALIMHGGVLFLLKRSRPAPEHSLGKRP